MNYVNADRMLLTRCVQLNYVNADRMLHVQREGRVPRRCLDLLMTFFGTRYLMRSHVILLTCAVLRNRSPVPVLPEADRRCDEPAVQQQAVSGLRQEPVSAVLRSRHERVSLHRRPVNASLHQGSSARRIQRRCPGEDFSTCIVFEHMCCARRPSNGVGTCCF